MEQEKIGRYLVEKVLGEGGMGLVYKAFDPIIERTVAIKTIFLDRYVEKNAREEYMERFFREARISGGFQHPNIVSVYDLGEHQGRPYIVMEFVEGSTFEELIRSGKELPKERYLSLIGQAAEGLDAAHSRGIIHRDVKPLNIMLSTKGRVKVLDFGIAKMADSNMTRTGQFMGTPKYASPEQIRDLPLKAQTDQFALAVVAHQLLTGVNPFAASSTNSILFKIAQDEPDLRSCPSFYQADDRQVKQIFLKALSKDPGARFEKIGDFVHALRRALGASGDNTTQSMGTDSFREDRTQPPIIDQTRPLEPFDERIESQLREARRRGERIQQLRDQFQASFRAGNLNQCEGFCRKLEREETDVVSENKALNLLRSRLRAENDPAGNPSKRSSENATLRGSFRDCLKKGRVDEAIALLERLRDLNTTIGEESDLLEQYLKQEPQKASKVQEFRQKFQRALQAGDRSAARRYLLHLESEGESLEQDRAALAQLEKEQTKNRSWGTSTGGNIPGPGPIPLPSADRTQPVGPGKTPYLEEKTELIQPITKKAPKSQSSDSRKGRSLGTKFVMGLVAIIFVMVGLLGIHWYRKSLSPPVDPQTPADHTARLEPDQPNPARGDSPPVADHSRRNDADTDHSPKETRAKTDPEMPETSPQKDPDRAVTDRLNPVAADDTLDREKTDTPKDRREPPPPSQAEKPSKKTEPLPSSEQFLAQQETTDRSRFTSLEPLPAKDKSPPGPEIVSKQPKEINTSDKSTAPPNEDPSENQNTEDRGTPTVPVEKTEKTLPEKPAPVEQVQEIPTPVIFKAFKHKHRKRFGLTGKAFTIRCDLRKIPAEAISEVQLSWRNGLDDYVNATMQVRGDSFKTLISDDQLQTGVLDYYFVVKLKGGREVVITDKGKPFSTKLRRASPQGF